MLEDLTREELINLLKKPTPQVKYYTNNKDKINAKRPCDKCQTLIIWKNRNTHYLTKKCQKSQIKEE